jgi:hypothetical protein
MRGEVRGRMPAPRLRSGSSQALTPNPDQLRDVRLGMIESSATTTASSDSSASFGDRFPRQCRGMSRRRVEA